MSMVPALSIRDLCVEYPRVDDTALLAVNRVSLSIAPGEIHAVVGESGAGKTTVANALIGLIEKPGRVSGGEILIAGRRLDVTTGKGDDIVLGRDIGVIFQDPMTSLNPVFTIEAQLTETMRYHLGLDAVESRRRAVALLNDVGISEPERRLTNYPHQLSGGQRQRVVIACALSCGPKLLIADEPTTSLDVSIQAQILDLIRDLTVKRGLGVMLVTHNMGVVAESADSVTVMQRGKAVEQGPVAKVLGSPEHPYTRGLMTAVPRLGTRLPRFAVLDEELGAAAAEARRAIAERQVVPGPENRGPILEVQGLKVDYVARGWLPGTSGRAFRAVDDVSFDVRAGEILGIVGESGSGKTTLANVIAGLVKPTAGTLRFEGKPVQGAGARRSTSRALQMIFQDPYASLNPRMRVGSILAEPILFYKLAASRNEAKEDAAMLLRAVGLEAEHADRFPFAFSGGQRQRISISRALAARPRLLICDEPTSSLDVSVQARILNLIKDIGASAGLTVILISHDLAVIRQMCDRVAVMKQGRMVELADAETLFTAPTHPYTRELIDLVPRIDRIGARIATAGEQA